MFAEQEVVWTRAIDKWLQVFEVLGFPGQLGAALDNELHFADPAEHGDRKSTRLNSSHVKRSRMPSSA